MHGKKLKLRVNDQVEVICGKDRGRVGKIIKLDRARNRALVERINMVVKHQKATEPGGQGQRFEKEAYIDISNLMLICPECTETVRVGYKYLEDGTKVRMCKKCKATIETAKK